MKKLFYVGMLGFILFEIANVYFIMPMPGSQKMNSIGLAYLLYSWRWTFRSVFALLIIAGIKPAFKASKIFPVIFILVLAGITYAANFKMAADAMFLQPRHLQMSTAANSKVDTGRIIIGIEFNGQAKAYPIQYLGYHHQVFDTISSKAVIVTYCTVCRTSRVFEPVVNGQQESFRLVGMNHFNAMFEDKTTKSWWRQATGEAIAGKLKGQMLPEFSSSQMSLHQWLSIYPNSLVMQPDSNFKVAYDSMATYENGKLTGQLTRRDIASWKDKSWVVGLTVGNKSKAYDWNELVRERILYDVLNNQPVAIVLANDNKSFIAFERTGNSQKFMLAGDTLTDQQSKYSLSGQSFTTGFPNLKKLNVYQEYWHSWRSFHPATQR